MCSLLNICSVNLLDNPLELSAPFRIEVIFEVFEYIKEEVEWELIFVGTDGNEEWDQLLDAVEIGQIRDGRHKFIFEAPAPKLETLRTEDLVDVTLLLLKCKFKNQLFLKVGWFVTHVYTDPELIANPPEQPIPEKMQRVISVDDCRVTKYAIKWNEMEEKEIDENVEMNEENNELEESQNELVKLQEQQQNVSDESDDLQENIELRVKELQNISVNKVESDERLSQESAMKSS